MADKNIFFDDELRKQPPGSVSLHVIELLIADLFPGFGLIWVKTFQAVWTRFLQKRFVFPGGNWGCE